MSLLDAYDLVIGFDTEYTKGRDLDGVPEDENAVVSYQAAYFHPATRRKGSGLYFTKGADRRHRHKLTSFLGRIFKALADEGIDIVDRARKARTRKAGQSLLKIALVAHFSRADLCGFSDFKRIKKKFDNVRGTFTTMQNPAVFEVIAPDGSRVKVSTTLFDTKLLAPAGAGSLRALGDLVGLPKLELPEVRDEEGNLIPGITRMDLAANQHPKEYAAYATRDCEVAVEYLRCVSDIAEEWGAKRFPPTIATMAVNWLLDRYATELCGMTGRERDKRGRPGSFLPEALTVQTIAADGYHGGRNEAYVHGIFVGTVERPFTDFDLKGAYTSSMAEFRDVDWAAIEHTKDIRRLAQIEEFALSRVDFEFPSNTRFPSLPVETGDGGLIFPLAGTATVTGYELLVAVNQGASIRVREGIRLPFVEVDPENSTLPFAGLAAFVNEGRSRHPKKSIPELLFKEAGNSGYGKLGQGVGVMKSIPERQAVFDSRSGNRKSLKPSRITSPVLAAMTSGLVRAVLSEILHSLPDYVRVLSATTDGWLSDATFEEALAAAQGPVCRYFAHLRSKVAPDGSDDILEVKHEALKVLVARTRHGVTIEPFNGSKQILARAGHKLPTEFNGDLAAECAAFLKLQKEREFGTALSVSSFLSLPQQWEQSADLLDEERDVAVSLDYDMKREPLEPIEHEGLLCFSTRPWRNLAEYRIARDGLDLWSKATQRILKTVDDYNAFIAWQFEKRRGSFANRTPFENAVVVAWSQGLCGLKIRTSAGRPSKDKKEYLNKRQVVEFLLSAGVPGVTAKVIDHSRIREADPRGTVARLFERDLELAKRLIQHTTYEALSELLEVDIGPLIGDLADQTIAQIFQNPNHELKSPQTASNPNTVSQTPEKTRVFRTMNGIKRNLPKVGRGEGDKGELIISPADPLIGLSIAGASLTERSDLQQLAAMKAIARDTYGITPARLGLAEKAARKNLGATGRDLHVAALTIAVAQKLKRPTPEILEIVKAITVAAADA